MGFDLRIIWCARSHVKANRGTAAVSAPSLFVQICHSAHRRITAAMIYTDRNSITPLPHVGG